MKLKMKKKQRVPYNNIFDAELIKNLKILAAILDKRQNDLLESGQKRRRLEPGSVMIVRTESLCAGGWLVQKS